MKARITKTSDGTYALEVKKTKFGRYNVIGEYSQSWNAKRGACRIARHEGVRSFDVQTPSGDTVRVVAY